MADLAELQQKQADAARFAMRMTEEKDPERLKQMAEELKARCDELARMAKSIEAALTPAAGTGAETTVLLTPAQRERIAQQTGVGIEAVTLRDTKDRQWSKTMPKADPREIEKAAAIQAAEARLKAETRTQVEKIIRELEKLNVPELAETIAELKGDPTLGLSGKK